MEEDGVVPTCPLCKGGGSHSCDHLRSSLLLDLPNYPRMIILKEVLGTCDPNIGKDRLSMEDWAALSLVRFIFLERP